MQDYPETLFQSLKKGCFPSIDGELEKQLRLAFLYGMDASYQLAIQATQLNTNECVQFFSDYQAAIERHLASHGKARAAVRMGTLGNIIRRN